MPVLRPEEVAHLARLSRLELSDAELSDYGAQLDVILSAVARVAEVAADDVPPTTHAVPVVNVSRTDTITPGLTPEEALSGAPAVAEGRFRVPRILDEE